MAGIHRTVAITQATATEPEVAQPAPYGAWLANQATIPGISSSNPPGTVMLG